METKITNIKNEEFLNNYDFYDVPGLNELLTTGKNNKEAAPTSEKSEFTVLKKNEEDEIEEEEVQKENKDIKIEVSNENMRYIKGIFKYIKTKIIF